jgi:hypothetical protein
LTGDNDPDINSLQHPQYIALAFYNNMAALLRRANLAISRSGAGSLTELAVCGKPAILIPYPFAAEDHQRFNAMVFGDRGAAQVYSQNQLTVETLENAVLDLLRSPEKLAQMAEAASGLAVIDSAERQRGSSIAAWFSKQYSNWLQPTPLADFIMMVLKRLILLPINASIIGLIAGMKAGLSSTGLGSDDPRMP